MPRQTTRAGRLARRNKALEALHTIGLDIGGQPDLPTLLRQIVEHAVRLLEADSGGGINLYDAETGLLHVVEAVGGGKYFLGRTLRPGKGLIGQTFATGQSTTVTDYPNWEGRAIEIEEPFFRAALASPLRWQDQIIGTIDVMSNRDGRVFTEDDIWLLELFAAQAAIAIGNARLHEAERAARARAAAMLEASQALSSSLSLPEVLQEILRSCNLVLPFVSGAIVTLDAGKPQLVVQVGYEGDEQTLVERMRSEIERSPIIRQVVEGQRCVLIPDVRKHPDWVVYPESAHIQSWMGVPLVAHRLVIGVLSLGGDRADLYTPEHAHLAEVLGTQAAIAIEHARLFGATQEALTQVEMLFRASQALTSARDVHALLDTFVELVASGADVHAVLLSLETGPDGLPRQAEVVAGTGGLLSHLVGRLYNLPDGDDRPDWRAGSVDLLEFPETRPIDDLAQLAFRPVVEDLSGESASVIPLTLEDRWVGVVALGWPGPHSASAQERQYYNVLRPQLAAIMENRRLLRATQEAETRFRDIAQSLSDWVWEVDRRGRIVYCSEQIEHVAGYPIKDVIGKSPLDFPHTPHFRRDMMAIMSHRIGLRPFVNMEAWFKHKEGHPLCILMSGVPIVDVHGHFKGYRGSAKDITAQKKAEQRERLAFDLGQKLTSVLSPDALLRTFIEQLVDTLGYYHVTVWQINRKSSALELVGGIRDFDLARIEQGVSLSVDAHPSLIAKAAREKRIIVSNDVESDPDYLAVEFLPDTRSEIVLPLIQGEQLLGVLNVESTEVNTFTPDEVRSLQNLAAQSTIAIENARLYARLSEQADLLEALVAQRTQDVVRERERLQAIVEHAGEGIIFTDPQGMIEYVNDAWEEITGHRARDIIGTNTADIFAANGMQSPFFPPYQFADSKVWQGELHAQRPDGSEYDAGLTVAPVTDARGRVINLVGVMHDITARKQVDQMRSKFVANVSHELRTPITNLKLYHTLISSVAPDKQPEYLSTMGDQLGRLENLVEDLLDISRLDRGVVEIHPETLDLNRVVNQMISSHRMRAERRGIQITSVLAEDIPQVWGDHKRLLQVVSNLLNNAVNYSPDGGTVKVCTWYATEEQGDQVAFSVSDAGIGIAPEDLPFIFDRFFRSETVKATGIPGTGLGLSIVHDIIDMHRGAIYVESTPGKGSTFTVRLPVMFSPD